MDVIAIQQTWDALAGRRSLLVDNFYSRLFELYPEYQKLFPESMTPQKDRMVETIGSVARFANHIDLIRAYVLDIGAAHRRIGISTQHVENFKEVLLNSLAVTCGESWEPRHEKAWREAFEDVIIPSFEEGLMTGTDASERRADSAS